MQFLKMDSLNIGMTSVLALGGGGITRSILAFAYALEVREVKNA